MPPSGQRRGREMNETPTPEPPGTDAGVAGVAAGGGVLGVGETRLVVQASWYQEKLGWSAIEDMRGAGTADQICGGGCCACAAARHLQRLPCRPTRHGEDRQRVRTRTGLGKGAINTCERPL